MLWPMLWENRRSALDRTFHPAAEGVSQTSGQLSGPLDDGRRRTQFTEDGGHARLPQHGHPHPGSDRLTLDHTGAERFGDELREASPTDGFEPSRGIEVGGAPVVAAEAETEVRLGRER